MSDILNSWRNHYKYEDEPRELLIEIKEVMLDNLDFENKYKELLSSFKVTESKEWRNNMLQILKKYGIIQKYKFTEEEEKNVIKNLMLSLDIVD